MSPERLAQNMRAELAGIKCRCGSVKKPAQTFCRQCYFLLSPQERHDLYKRIGRGYEAAYVAAVIHLVAEVRFGLPLWLDPPTEDEAHTADMRRRGYTMESAGDTAAAADTLPWNLDPPRQWCNKSPGCLGADGHAGDCDIPFS